MMYVVQKIKKKKTKVRAERHYSFPVDVFNDGSLSRVFYEAISPPAINRLVKKRLRLR